MQCRGVRPRLRFRHIGNVFIIRPTTFGAQRLQGAAAVNQVLINADLHVAIKRTFGPSKTDTYCTSIGELEFKGITDPPTQEAFEFDWKKYVAENLEANIATVIFNHLGSAGIEINNFSVSDMSKPGDIVWPVVPRDLATAIHRGQMELMRLMQSIGWRIVVLIADCDDEASASVESVGRFETSVRSYAQARGIEIGEFVQMKDMYEPSYPQYKELQHLFRVITTRMSVDELMTLNYKDYNQEAKEVLEKRPTLTHLRAPLTMAAVMHLAKQRPGKSAVISGSDEQLQWKVVYKLPTGSDLIGALMIPKLKMDRKHQVFQGRRWPIWESEFELVRHIGESDANTAWWVFRLLAFLPAFPETYVTIGEVDIGPQQWDDELTVPSNVSKTHLVQHVWPKLNPA